MVRNLLVKKVLQALRVDQKSQNSPEFENILAQHTQQQKTLLILDNVEDVLVKPNKEHFLTFVKEALDINNIKIISTSRRRFDVIGTAMHEIRLDSLDRESAKAVMKELYPDVSDDLASRIGVLSGGVPLLLELFGSQLRSGLHEVEDLISKLEEANVFVVANETEDITNSTNLYHLLRRLLSTVAIEQQELFIMLSPIPLPFTQDTANHLVNSDYREKIDLSRIVNISLLKHFKGIAGKIRFEIHPILRQFGEIAMQETREWTMSYLDTIFRLQWRWNMRGRLPMQTLLIWKPLLSN